METYPENEYTEEIYEADMDVGTYMIDTVKTNIKGWCKDTIENTKKEWPGVSYLFFWKESLWWPGTGW